MHLWSLALLLKTAAAGLASELWRENSATAQQSLWDPFVLGLGAGTLKKETFATYVAQDAASHAMMLAMETAHHARHQGMLAMATLFSWVHGG